MAIAKATQAQREALLTAATNTLKAIEVYRSDSNNPALNTSTDAALTNLKATLDIVVAAA